MRRFIRDADARTYDCEVLRGIDVTSCFDAESLAWYRGIFSRRYPAHETESADHAAFLLHFGLVVPDGATLMPTRAALLLFGSSAAINQVLPRAVVDVRRLIAGSQEVMPEERWDDRRLLEGNLIRCWREGVQYFTERVADRPFQVDASTLHYQDFETRRPDGVIVPTPTFTLSFDAIIGDAESRNHTFLEILKSGMKALAKSDLQTPTPAPTPAATAQTS